MDLDVDIHDKFIADCAAEAQRKSMDEVEKGRQSAEDIIRSAEASRAQIFATPGKTNQLTRSLNPNLGNEGVLNC